ncbi:MAG: TRAP transporter substrate-binding protein [Pseudomonadota bacterium]
MLRTLALGTLCASLLAAPASAVTLVGASQFNEDHAFTKAMRKFEEEVQACYDGDVEFRMHLNSELGLEKDYFENMSQGIAVDYAIVSPAHMSTFSQMAPLMDMPFLFRDLDHWNKAIDAGTLEPIAEDILETANVRIIGYAGGGTRNVFANEPVRNMEELKDLPIRMQGAPIWTRIFDALGAAPTVIAYSEVYNAIQTGVIKAAENEAAGIEQMKFYEVGPEVALTQHAITVRPLAFSNATFERLPEALQQCILEAGAEGGRHGRMIESGEDEAKMDAMEEAGLLTRHDFADRDRLLELAEPVMRAYAEELGALEVYENISAIQ